MPEVIPYHALSNRELLAVHNRLARERGKPLLRGLSSRVALIQRIAILRTVPKLPPMLKARKLKPSQRKTLVYETAARLLCEVLEYRKANGRTLSVGHSYETVVKRLRQRHRKANTTIQAVRGIASKIRHGLIPGTLPDIRLAPKKESRK